MFHVRHTKELPRMGESLVFFFQDTLKTAFSNENLNNKRTQTGHFFLKSGHFFCKIRALLFCFQKKAEAPLPFSPLVAHR